MIHKIVFSLFIAGAVLLVINVTGLFIDLRNDDIYNEKFSNNFGIKLTKKEFHKELEKIKASEMSDSAAATSVSLLVNRSLAHYWNRNIKKYNIFIPLHENWILFLDSYINPEPDQNGITGQHEYLNWRKAIERGVGLCSQHAIITSGILNENGIQTGLAGLSGHVIATAELKNGKSIVLDPDYGVNIPYSLQEIESNTDIIEPYYSQAGYDEKRINTLKKIFGKEGNRTFKDAKAYAGKRGRFETMSYWGIWIIPLLLMVPFLLVKRRVNSKVDVSASREAVGTSST